MSLYNMMFGVHPSAGPALRALNLTPGDFGRFRDAHISREGENEELRITVLTRTGGNNRADYAGEEAALREHPHFLERCDETYDCTYATYVFSVPEELAEVVEDAERRKGERFPALPTMRERFEAALAALKGGD